MTKQASFTGRAPGRIDVMGGVADYSGSLVLQMPIVQETTVRFTQHDDNSITVISRDGQTELNFSATLGAVGLQETIDYDDVRARLRHIEGGDWASYVVGCIAVLIKEKNIEYTGGRFVIESDVPLGKGVSSSAALEIATMNALEACFGVSFQGTEKAVLAQRAENRVVGAPCGLMDQLVCAFGKHNCLLPIVCQPDILEEPCALPPGVFFKGIDSGVKHSVGASHYSRARAAAFMGYSFVVSHEGMERKDFDAFIGKGRSEQLPYGGYLANIGTEKFMQLENILPESIAGKNFLAEYGGTIDPIVRIEEETVYPVRAAVRHAVYENHRISEFLALLLRANKSHADLRDCLRAMGELMFQSHQSYTEIGLGHEMTDRIAGLVSECNSNGLYGARITGGGSGGTVCVLGCDDEGLDKLRYVTGTYEKISGYKPMVI